MAMTACAAKFVTSVDLLVGERANLLAVDADGADQFILLEHRHDDNRPNATEIDDGDEPDRFEIGSVVATSAMWTDLLGPGDARPRRWTGSGGDRRSRAASSAYARRQRCRPRRHAEQRRPS